MIHKYKWKEWGLITKKGNIPKIKNYSKDSNVNTFKRCYKQCANDAACQSFYWDHENQRCNLKSVAANKTASKGPGNSVCYSRIDSGATGAGDNSAKKDKSNVVNVGAKLTKTYDVPTSR